MKQTVRIAGGIHELFGTLDENLKLFESSLQVRTRLNDHDIEIQGEPPQVERAVRILGDYNQRIRDGKIPNSQEVKSLLRIATEEPTPAKDGAFSANHTRTFGKKSVAPKSANQKRYLEAMETHDMVFGIGPGGTGKTYLAVAMAVSALLSKQVDRIILARPAVEAGEKLGFLPGTLQEKVDPYMRPLYDALHDLLDAEKLGRFLEKGVVEVAPLAFMRGRTLNDSFVILDEAQNTTSEQMKMFLTRLGFNSKAVITGDVTQIDLPTGRRSGLVEAIEVVGDIEGISLVYFDEHDVVRHNLVQRIIKAYEEHGGGSSSGHTTGHAGGHTAGTRTVLRVSRNSAPRHDLSCHEHHPVMIQNRQRRVRIPLKALNVFLVRACEELLVPAAAVTVCLVTNREMARWNRTYRGKDRPTDVLSFTVESEDNGSAQLQATVKKKRGRGNREPDAKHLRRAQRAVPLRRQMQNLGVGDRRDAVDYLGDIAIAPDVARRNAQEFGRTFGDEMRILILHGILHLMGYDHETDTGQMERRERRLRRTLGLTGSGNVV